MESIEVWVNDKLLCAKKVNKEFTKEDTSVEIEVVVPKDVYFKGVPEIKSLGLRPVLPQPNHGYEIKVEVECLGFNKPEFKWEVNPHCNFIIIKELFKNPTGARASIFIPINKNWNNNYDYEVKVVVKEDNISKSATLKFSIPKPVVDVSETSFSGGNMVFMDLLSREKFLLYEGEYEPNMKYFGVSSYKEFKLNWETDAKLEEIGRATVKLEFKVPPYKYSYKLKLTCKDIFGVQEATIEKTIPIPELTAESGTIFKEKIKSYTLKDFPGLSEVISASPEEEIGSIYNKVVVWVAPYITRFSPEKYLAPVLEPKYDLKVVDENNREVPYRFVSEWVSIEEDGKLIPWPKGASSAIEIDLSQNKIVTVTIEVKDTVGQTVKIEKNLKIARLSG